MNRTDLQKLSMLRFDDAKLLIQSEHYAAAYYIAGYSIECAIKSCIAKQTKRYSFPDKETVNRAWSHDLENLVGIAGLKTSLQNDIKTSKSLEINWAIVKDWNESSRYDINISREQANDFYYACFNKKDGMLFWIKRRW